MTWQRPKGTRNPQRKNGNERTARRIRACWACFRARRENSGVGPRGVRSAGANRARRGRGLPLGARVARATMPDGDGKGTAFFVRHGESTSNDRNVFAGACCGAAPSRASCAFPGPVVAAQRRVPHASDTATRAGIHDVYLTEYGKQQARRAGQVRPRRRVSLSGAQTHPSQRRQRLRRMTTTMTAARTRGRAP